MWSTILGDPGAVSRGGKKARRKFSSTGRRAPGYQPTRPFPTKRSSECWLLIGHKKSFVLLCPIGQQNLMSSFCVIVHDGYCLARKKKQKQNTKKIDWVPIQTRFPQKITKTLPLLRELSDASCMSQHVLRDNWLEIQLRNKLVLLVPDASKLDRAIHRIDYYPVLDKCYGNQLRYPLLDSVIQKFYCISLHLLSSAKQYP